MLQTWYYIQGHYTYLQIHLLPKLKTKKEKAFLCWYAALVQGELEILNYRKQKVSPKFTEREN